MRVLFVHHAHAKGGAAVSLFVLLKHLAGKDVTCSLLNCSGIQEVEQFYRPVVDRVHNLRVWPYPHSSLGWWPMSRLSSILRVARWILLYPISCLSMTVVILRGNYDAAHFNSATLISYGWIPRLLGIKLICHVREPFAAGHFGMRREFLRTCLKAFCSKVIAICEDNASDTHLSSLRVDVIYNPVDFTQFDCDLSMAENRRLLGVNEGSFVTLFAGGSNAQVKGVEEYLLSMLEVSERVPSLVCLMPSFQPSTLHSEAALEAYRILSERILMPEFVRDIERWIAVSDVVFALHNKPHFSRTVMEAGAMKRPVVVTDIAGISEVATDGQTGCVCDVGGIAEITKATLKLYEQPKLRAKLGFGGYEQACQLFHADRHASAVLDVYHEVLG